MFFLDDDVVLDKRFIEIINDTFIKLEKYNVAGIAGRITNTKKTYNLIDRIFKKAFFLTDCGKGKVKLSGLPEHKIDRELGLVKVLPGGCTAYLKKIFSYYLFDEKLEKYSYLEDVDFSYRVGKNYLLIYQPHAKLQHFATTFRKRDSKNLRKMMVKNHKYLFKKNMPKDFVHITAFILSIVGLLAYNSLLMRDFKACKGVIKGLIEKSN